MGLDIREADLLQQETSHRAERLLRQYRRTLEQYCRCGNEAEKNLCIDAIIKVDGFMDENNKILRNLASERAVIEEKLAQLQRMTFYARCGDYMARDLGDLKAAAYKLGDRKLLPEY